jgi:hypothetical protein
VTATPPAVDVLAVLSSADPGRAVHDVRATFHLNHATAIRAIRTAARHHGGHPVADAWAFRLRILDDPRRPVLRTDPVTDPGPRADRDAIDRYVDAAVDRANHLDRAR